MAPVACDRERLADAPTMNNIEQTTVPDQSIKRYRSSEADILAKSYLGRFMIP